MGDSVRGRGPRFDWSGNDCAFGRGPVSFSITGSESPDHMAAMRYRMQESKWDVVQNWGHFFFFLKGSHTHAHIPVWLFEGC